MKRKTIPAIAALLIGAGSFSACQPAPPDDGLGAALLLFLLLNQEEETSTSGPNYELVESTFTPSGSSGGYYSGGETGYTRLLDAVSIGIASPNVIYQAEQSHAVANGYVDFQQRVNGGSFHLTRGLGSGGDTRGTVMHFYGHDTSIYTTSSTTISPSSESSMEFVSIVPHASNTVTLRRVKSLVAASSEEQSFTPDSTTSDHGERGMSHVWSAGKQLKFNFIFLDGSYTDATLSGISTAVEKVTTVYSQNTVKITPVYSSTTISAPDYLNLTSLDTNVTTTGSLGGLFVNTASAQDKDAVNVYFVKSESAVGGVLGVSGGIPGLPGVAGTRNSAMVVIFDSHISGSLDQTLLGETIAHEAGHWLGLNHLTESVYDTGGSQNNYTRDGISETPRCSQTNVDTTVCDGTNENNSGARNVMFRTGASGFTQPNLTGEQGWVLRRHPLVYY